MSEEVDGLIHNAEIFHQFSELSTKFLLVSLNFVQTILKISPVLWAQVTEAKIRFDLSDKIVIVQFDPFIFETNVSLNTHFDRSERKPK